MDAIIITAKLLGALGVFLFGMKLMSEGLQKVAGARLKALLNRATSNRVKGVLTGFVITSIVQSSSATTVMVVGFVNAKLLQLKQAIGIIMGANIGTTVTGWLVALLGFKVKISAFALPIIGIGFIMSFLRGAKPKQVGETMIGFGLLFLGLALMKQQIPKVEGDDVLWLESLLHMGIASHLLFVLIGTLLTVALQSSSATMALTLTLVAQGVIPYEAAAAMILGENIGTTATANIAAIGTSVVARRAARAHFLFNIFGVIWALALLDLVLLPVVDAIVPGSVTDGASAAAHLAALHTLFNITNTLVALPFLKQLTTMATRWVPEPEVPSAHVSKYLSTSLVKTPGLLLAQAGKEMQHMTEEVRTMYRGAMKLLSQPRESHGTLVDDTLRAEEKVDALEREIIEVLTRTARAATAQTSARQIGEMALNTHRLERIGDHCEKLVYLAVSNHEAAEHKVAPAGIEDIQTLAHLVDESLENLGRYLGGEATMADAQAIEDKINASRDTLRDKHVKRLQESDDDIVAGLRLLDIFHHLEEVGDRAYGIVRRAEATKLL